jgi:thiamine biosynthesis lipoprotein
VPLSVPLRPADPYWQERRFTAMGSTAHLQVGDAPGALVDWAVAEVDRLEQCWSRFRPDSELSRLNALAGRWTEVSSRMLLILQRAHLLWAASGGAFDPTVLPALERLGYDRSFELLPIGGEEREALAPTVDQDMAAPGFGPVEIDTAGLRVRLPVGTRLDLGGLGKGLAGDLVAEGLVDRGARSALISLGGDLRAAGEAPDGGWRIPVEDPFVEGSTRFERVLERGALVTSTCRFRRWSHQGREVHHLIDPRSGEPAETGVFAVVAQGPEGWWTEGLAKAVLVRGAAEAPALLDQTGVTVTIFGDDGSVLSLDG